MSRRKASDTILTNIRNDVAGVPLRVCVCCGGRFNWDGQGKQHVCPECRNDYNEPCCDDPRIATQRRSTSDGAREFVTLRCANCGFKREMEL